ncbi:MAG: ABC transporter substrate-binding protein [Chloroflexota bacterium]
MRKSFLIVLLLCAFVVPVAAQDEPVTIEFFYPTSTDNPAAEIFQRYADEFNAANPDTEVVPVYAGGYDDITAAARNSIENDIPGPDVAVLLVVDLFNFIENDYIVPAQQFIDEMDGGDEYVSDFFPAFMENSVDGDGTVWTIPFQRSTPILFYNKDMFREADLDPDQPPRNRDELVEYATALTGDDQWGVYIPSAGFPYWLFQSFAVAHGQNVVGAADAEVFYDAPEVVEALEFFMSLSEEHAVMPPGAISFFDTPGAFFDEQVAMIYHTTGSLTNILENADFEVGVGFLPGGPAGADGTGYGSPTGGGNLYIFSNTSPEKQEAAWRWVEYLTSPELQADWTVNTGYIAARQSAWETATLEDLVEDRPEYAIARDQLEYARKELSTHDGIAVRGILNDALASVIAGEAEPQAALEAAQADANAILEPYR